MIKLRSLYKEIKIIGKVTPEMVLDIWDKLYDPDKQIKMARRFDILDKYDNRTKHGRSVTAVILDLPYQKLKLLYQDLLNLKNS